MSEDWRNKTYYKPRILIETARVLSPQFADSMLCITGAQLEMLRNLVGYLERRSTFVSDYHDVYYVAPDNEEWDQLQTIVADLEETLMGCQEFTEALENLVAQVACLCSAANRGLRDGPALPKLIDDGLDDGTLVPGDTNGPTIPAAGDRCDLAQLTYWMAWELLTEVIQPLQDVLTDILMPFAMVALAAMIGVPVFGIPVGALLAFLWNLAEIWEDGEMTNLQNTFRAYEDELICAVYQGLAINYQEAKLRAKTVIDDMADTSPIDKKVFQFLFSPWAMSLCQTALDNETAWAESNVVEGRCDDCDVIEGTDWYAVPISVPLGDIEMDHSTPGDYWVNGGVCGEVRDATICGMVLECVELTGCTLELTYQHDVCTGDDIMDNEGYDVHSGDLVYVYKAFTHDEDEAIEDLCPGAEKYEEIVQLVGPGNWELGAHLGWSCTGEALLRVKYIVYQGTL